MSYCIWATTRPKSGTKRPNTLASFMRRRIRSGPFGEVTDISEAGLLTPVTGEGFVEIDSSPGALGEAAIFIAITSRFPDPPVAAEAQKGESNNIRGYNLSVAADNMEVTRVRTRGTIAEDLQFLDEDEGMPDPDGGKAFEGFRSINVAPADMNDGQWGATAGIVLSFFRLELRLLPNGVATVLRMEVQTLENIPDDGGTITGVMRFQDGLSSGAQGIINSPTITGPDQIHPEGDPLLKNRFCNRDDVRLNVNFVAPGGVGAYVGGDANGDARIDLADPIWTINSLFRGGDASPCTDGADANDDGLVDLADSMFLINYLFFSGDRPSGPVECAVDPESTPGSCPEGSTLCP